MIGIETITLLIQAALNDLSQDLTPVRNLTADRQRVRERLQASSSSLGKLNKERRDNIKYSVGDFVLLHRASRLHVSKTNFEFLGPYEIRGITKEGRYELKRVGARKHKIIKAAKEQLRFWPAEWSVSSEMDKLLELLDAESVNNEGKLNLTTDFFFFPLLLVVVFDSI